MVVEITSRSIFDRHENVRLSADGLSAIQHSNNELFGYRITGDDHWGFFTQQPVVTGSHTSFESLDSIHQTTDLARLQNEVSGISIRVVNGQLKLLIFSARMSRSRVYFLLYRGSLFLTFDLREILPLSTKTIDKEIVFGILKFGEMPEFHTLIEDINTVPVGCYLEARGTEIRNILSAGELSIAHFTPYHQVGFPQSGGSVEKTKSLLKDILSYLNRFRPGILVSGGIDSSLINYLYNEVSDKPYPAFFFDFDDAPQEKEFVIQSLKGTKAELVPVSILGTHVMEEFERSVAKLIYPVYDNGSALVGQIFSDTLHRGFGKAMPLVDGTVADSCYGVRDYRAQLKVGARQSVPYSLFKEWIFSNGELWGFNNSRSRPRDSFLADEFLQDLLWYGGVYINLWFPRARQYTTNLREKYYWYLNMLEPRYREQYWPRYTILKMLLYASGQTTVKVYDMLLPTPVYFPFMFKTILDDQGTYTWEEKSENGIVKAPLKKLLSTYASPEFVYRKKAGLQSQTKQWMTREPFRSYLEDLVFNRGSLAEEMTCRYFPSLRKAYRMKNSPGAVLSLVLSIAVTQLWLNKNGLNTAR